MSATRRDFLKAATALPLAASAAGSLAASRPAAAPSGSAAGDPWVHVAPELRPMTRSFEDLFAKQPPLDAAHLAEHRGHSWTSPPRLADVPVTQRRVPTAHGPDVAVFVVNEKAGAARPGILSTHGGGFVLGTAEGDVPFLQPIARALDCCIVTVDYRLAPETTWKGSVEDNYAALAWLHGHAAELGVDPGRLAVMGGSAGGGHAALLALLARDRGEVPLVFQCLTYPMLDDRTGSTRAVPWPIGALGWKADSNVFGWTSFLGVPAGGPSVPAAGVPARAKSLAGLPPAFIGVGSIDLFVEEDIEYARRLVRAGVATELVVVPGATHGFDFAAETTIARQFSRVRLNALRRAFGISPEP